MIMASETNLDERQSICVSCRCETCGSDSTCGCPLGPTRLTDATGTHCETTDSPSATAANTFLKASARETADSPSATAANTFLNASARETADTPFVTATSTFLSSSACETADSPSATPANTFVGASAFGNATSIATAEEPVAPVTEDDIQILSLIGEGGMGSVFKVLYKPLDKIMALKMVRADLAKDRIAAKRFEEEARAASSLTHANMAAVYKYGKDGNDRPYLLMDYIEGLCLSDIIKSEGYVESDRALNIFIEIVDAVIHAHMKGILHRDLKPSNIMLVGDRQREQVKVLDFGIAKVLTESMDQNLTKTGDIVGSPLYMSPEQGMGLPLDIRSDIYSLGCIMYETLLGHPPYIGKTAMETIVKHASAAVPDFAAALRDHGLNEHLERVVLKCLAKNASDRYQTTQDLRLDLDLIRHGKSPKFASRLTKESVSKLSNSKRLSLVTLGGLIALLPLCYSGYFIAVKKTAIDPAVVSLNESPVAAPALLLKNRQKQIDKFTREIALHPGDKFWYMKRAQAYCELKKSEECIADYTKVLELDDRDIHALTNRGAEYSHLQKFDLSLADLNKVLALVPDHINALSNRAGVYGSLGRIKEAILDGTKGIALDPLRPDSYNNRAMAYLRLNDFGSALRDLNRAVELDPELAITYSNRGVCYTGLKRYDEAIKDCTMAIKIEPEAEHFLSRAKAYREKREFGNALADCEEALRLKPNLADALECRAQCYSDLGKQTLSIRDYTAAIKLNPSDIALLEKRAYQYFTMRNYEAALADCDSAIKMNGSKYASGLREWILRHRQSDN